MKGNTWKFNCSRNQFNYRQECEGAAVNSNKVEIKVAILFSTVSLQFYFPEGGSLSDTFHQRKVGEKRNRKCGCEGLLKAMVFIL
jgi:hypothetical protein